MSENNDTPVVFHSFDPKADIHIRDRNLPHWFQPVAATFITFRTVDSIPQDVILRWQRELEEWLRVRDCLLLAESVAQCRLSQHDELLHRLNAADRQEFKRLSDRIFHRSLDECHGACLLKQLALAEIVANGSCIFRFPHGKRQWIGTRRG